MQLKSVNSTRHFFGPKLSTTSQLQAAPRYTGVTWDQDNLNFSGYYATFDDDLEFDAFSWDEVTLLFSSDQLTMDKE